MPFSFSLGQHVALHWFRFIAKPGGVGDVYVAFQEEFKRHAGTGEDFLVAEASDVSVMRFPDRSANLASISSAKRQKARPI